LRYVDALSFPLRRGRALDFGCGVGRLTQALSRRFHQCDGVDIAPSMIKLARKYVRPWRRLWSEVGRLLSGRPQWADCWAGVVRVLKGPNCRFVLNASNDLALFGDDTFDFIYSSLVLQHMKPEYSQNYIKEFLRVLAPGGLAVFQIPSRPLPTRELPYKASVRVDRSALTVERGKRVTIPIHVKNLSNLTWPALNLGNHWLNEAGEMMVNDDGRAPLPTGMKPQQEAKVAITVTAPKRIGGYWLEFDVVHESVVWFNTMGSETARLLCQVRAGGLNLTNLWGGLTNRIRASRGYRLAVRLYRKVLNSIRTKTPALGFEPIMETYGVPKDVLTKWIETHGGRIVDIQEDFSVGKDWESFRYFVTKP
jgi:SAM-dependent methyltransferase